MPSCMILGRVKYETVGDEEAMEAFFKLSRYEGIIPAIESSHAVAYAMRRAKENKTWLHPGMLKRQG